MSIVSLTPETDYEHYRILKDMANNPCLGDDRYVRTIRKMLKSFEETHNLTTRELCDFDVDLHFQIIILGIYNGLDPKKPMAYNAEVLQVGLIHIAHHFEF